MFESNAGFSPLLNRLHTVSREIPIQLFKIVRYKSVLVSREARAGGNFAARHQDRGGINEGMRLWFYAARCAARGVICRCWTDAGGQAGRPAEERLAD